MANTEADVAKAQALRFKVFNVELGEGLAESVELGRDVDAFDPVCDHLLVEHVNTGEVIGTVTGVDHVEAFNDPEGGSSLWCLAVDPQCLRAGVGEALTRALLIELQAEGRNYCDLSVMHDNVPAIRLYEKLGFQRVPVFVVKRKNPINEPLFVGPVPDEISALNPYARIIADEARRRGIVVDVIDAEGGFVKLTYGGRSVRCRESLSEFTSAVAMSICDDKAMTRRFATAAGAQVPDEVDGDDEEAIAGNRAGIDHGVCRASGTGLQGNFVERVPGGFHINLLGQFGGAEIVECQPISEHFSDGLDSKAVVRITRGILETVDRGERDRQLAEVRLCSRCSHRVHRAGRHRSDVFQQVRKIAMQR